MRGALPRRNHVKKHRKKIPLSQFGSPLIFKVSHTIPNPHKLHTHTGCSGLTSISWREFIFIPNCSVSTPYIDVFTNGVSGRVYTLFFSLFWLYLLIALQWQRSWVGLTPVCWTVCLLIQLWWWERCETLVIWTREIPLPWHRNCVFLHDIPMNQLRHGLALQQFKGLLPMATWATWILRLTRYQPVSG